MDTSNSDNKNAVIPDFVSVINGANSTKTKSKGKSNFKLLLIIGISILILASLGIVLYSIFRPKGTTTNNTNTALSTIGTNLNLVDTNATGTVRIWGLWEKDSDFQVIVDEFKKKYPNVTVQYTNREIVNNGDPSKYKAELISRIKDGGSSTSPDIFLIHSNWTEQMQKYMYPMPTSVYTSEEYKNVFYQTFTDTFTASDKKIYAIPSSFDALGLYYNKKLLNAAGYSLPATNWDDFRTQVFALSARDSKGDIISAGVSAGTINNVAFGFDLLSLLMLQNGTTMTNAAGNQFLFAASDQAIEAMKFYSDLGNEKQVWDADLPLDVRLFAEGKLAMMFAPAWRADGIRKSNALLDFDVAPVPQLSNISAGSRVDLASYWGFSVSKYASNPSLAWTFLKFYSEKDSYRTLYKKTSQTRYISQIYPRRDMVGELSGVQYINAFLQMANTAKTWKMYDRERVEAIFRKEINTGIAKGATISFSTAKSALERIASGLAADVVNFK